MDEAELLHFIVCPVCRGELTKVEAGSRCGFACANCNVVYPIEREIPLLLPESGIAEAKWREDACASS